MSILFPPTSPYLLPFPGDMEGWSARCLVVTEYHLLLLAGDRWGWCVYGGQWGPA